jgi:hypothetical protein
MRHAWHDCAALRLDWARYLPAGDGSCVGRCSGFGLELFGPMILEARPKVAA